MASKPRPRTSKCVLEDVLEAKDVLEDSTSVFYRRDTGLRCMKGNRIVRRNVYVEH